MIKILYNQKQTKRSFIIGLITVIFGAASQILSSNYIFSCFIGLGIAYIGIYLIQTYSPYVLITKDFVHINGFRMKKIAIKDISEISYFAGDYTIIKAGKRFVIDTNSVDKRSLPPLRQFVADFAKK